MNNINLVNKIELNKKIVKDFKVSQVSILFGEVNTVSVYELSHEDYLKLEKEALSLHNNA